MNMLHFINVWTLLRDCLFLTKWWGTVQPPHCAINEMMMMMMMMRKNIVICMGDPCAKGDILFPWENHQRKENVNMAPRVPSTVRSTRTWQVICDIFVFFGPSSVLSWLPWAWRGERMTSTELSGICMGLYEVLQCLVMFLSWCVDCSLVLSTSPCFYAHTHTVLPQTSCQCGMRWRFQRDWLPPGVCLVNKWFHHRLPCLLPWAFLWKANTKKKKTFGDYNFYSVTLMLQVLFNVYRQPTVQDNCVVQMDITAHSETVLPSPIEWVHTSQTPSSVLQYILYLFFLFHSLALDRLWCLRCLHT